MATAVDNAPIQKDWPPGLFAGELFQRSVEYQQAARLIDAQPGEMLYAKFFLTFHSMELLLKSFLAACGMPRDDVEKRYGHKLDKLYRDCGESGFPSVKYFKELLEELHDRNSSHDFRYPTDYILPLPEARHYFDVMDQAREAIAPIISKAAISATVKFAADTRHQKGQKFTFAKPPKTPSDKPDGGEKA